MMMILIVNDDGFDDYGKDNNDHDDDDDNVGDVMIIGSLSNGVFERRTSTGSGLFASLGSGLVETLW